MKKVIFLALCLVGLNACGSGGNISFTNPNSATPPSAGVNISAPFASRPAGEALMIENSMNTTTGYHAKVEANPLSQQTLTGGGYTMKLKFTSRNR